MNFGFDEDECEWLAEECNAYIIFMLQQAVGSSATVHYTSPRLCREAKEDTLEIIQQYQTLMNNLVLAKRQEALALAKQLYEAQDEANEARTHAQAAEAQV
ncbi:hypothetical protein P691DRAFT_768681 [Macrolepiota fuliginosa MF-IS2]|uniref:Uncharacterized protein n=1 Tax=Macrolepiota fuliginosa MF-IS2 TaxID=1400762 RepID=A0A9P6BVK3_9AGAR|nr:hypothetical protein P691DRAFT_768681 [Macrolepiota fuliginosa MF-IS2]